MGKKKRGICIFCNKEKSLTKDHIPPKCLFSSPRPRNLIYVPCCYDCKRGQSREDEYFKTLFALRADLRNHPVIANNILPSVRRSFNKSEAKNFPMRIFKSITDVEVVTKAGIYLGKAKAIKPEYNRLEFENKRIIRGLYYHETNTILPLNVNIDVRIVDESFAIKPKSFNDFNNYIIQPVLNQEMHAIGDVSKGKCTFRYWYLLTSDNPQASVWFLYYYDKVLFLAFTHP